MSKEPVVLQYKTTYLQRICDYVRLGYRYWCTGEVTAERAGALVKKFETLYGTGQSRHQRAYAKRNGQACAVLLLYAPSTALAGQSPAREGPTSAQVGPSTARLQWMLLVTPGDHLAQRLESLRDATCRQGRIEVTGYELVTLPRPGQVRPAWTWRMTIPTYEGWRLRLVAAPRRGHQVVAEEIRQLARTPGFAGCRVQCKKLQQLARGELARRFPAGPRLPLPRLRYVQRLANDGAPLTAWIKWNLNR